MDIREIKMCDLTVKRPIALSSAEAAQHKTEERKVRNVKKNENREKSGARDDGKVEKKWLMTLLTSLLEKSRRLGPN